MNAAATSSVLFVGLTGLFWAGWFVGAQTPEGQAALARAYAAYAEDQAAANEDLFAADALRAIVCGGDSQDPSQRKPCLAVIAGGKLFMVDAGSGAASSLARRNIPLGRLHAVLLTGIAMTQTADLGELYSASATSRENPMMPVYGPAETQRMVEGLNQVAGLDGIGQGLQAWGPGPEPGRSVIVFEEDGLSVSAFTTEGDFQQRRIGYRFDFRGRSLVVGGDGRIVGAQAAENAEVVLQGAQTEALAHLHQDGYASAAEVAAQAHAANAGLVVLTGAENRVAAQMQVAEARAAGFDDVIAGRIGMLLELPLRNSEVNVRPL
jgi:ribonuclease Z